MNYLEYRERMIRVIATRGFHTVDFLKRRTEKELETLMNEHLLFTNEKNNQIQNKKTVQTKERQMIKQEKDLSDLQAEFGLMLRGFVSLTAEVTSDEQMRERLLCAWEDLAQEIEKNGRNEI